jgi:hypothetical protein
MKKFLVRDYNYLLNRTDMSLRFFYSIALKNKTDKDVLQGFTKLFDKSNI